MTQNNIATVENYYRAMGENDINGMHKYLHPNVKFVSPLTEMVGRESVLESAQKLVMALNFITMKAKFSFGDQVMLAYDFHFQPPIGIAQRGFLLCKMHS